MSIKPIMNAKHLCTWLLPKVIILRSIYLLNHGANIHARTVNNWLPIHHATRFRHAQIANYLKQRGSAIYARTSDGLSAVDMAKAVNDSRILGIFGVR